MNINGKKISNLVLFFGLLLLCFGLWHCPNAITPGEEPDPVVPGEEPDPVKLFDWSKLTTSSPIWSARYDHQTLVMNGKMWVLGGFDNQASTYNDVWWSSDG